MLLDGTVPAVDRDLIGAAREAGCVVLVIDDGRAGRDWAGLGAAAVPAPGFRADVLLDSLATHAAMVGRQGAAPSTVDPATPAASGSLPSS